MSTVKSPCNGVCKLCRSKTQCTSCGRSLFAISYWNSLTDEEKEEELEKAKRTLELYESSYKK